MTQPLSIQDTFCRNVIQTIQDHDMVHPKDAVLIGVSGGPDSMALARVMICLAPDLDLRLCLAHLNHGLRGMNADQDQVFTKKFAAMHGLPFFCEQMDVATLAKQARTSVEETGRNARYDFFARMAATHGYTRIATGHTRDDNAEQVLMSLLRGSGSKGLAGIPPSRNHRFIRPLINRSRTEILAFLRDLDQTYIMDDSNQDPAFLRNRVRNHLIPLLENDYNPGIKQGLHRVSRILHDENLFLASHASLAFDSCLNKKESSAIYLSIHKMLALHPALIPRVLRCGIRTVKSNLRQITYEHILAVQDLVSRAESGKHLDLPDRIRVYKTRHQICIKKETMDLRRLGRLQKQAKRLPPEA
ncbi:MAG: tRNA lysidine(34) synthetase TilS [Desulfotignum sp.]|nr:tRNA lysidine(34) synthetase TilS [Desulfotignum sp.]